MTPNTRYKSLTDEENNELKVILYRLDGLYERIIQSIQQDWQEERNRAVQEYLVRRAKRR